MKRFILTDIGNVLVRFRPIIPDVTKEILDAAGVNDPDLPMVIQETLFYCEEFEVIQGEDCLTLGKITLLQFFNKLKLRYQKLDNLRHGYPLFFSLWCKHLEPIEEVIAIYLGLQEKFPLVAVSNGDSEGVSHIIYYLAGRYKLKFSKVFISADEQKKKPDLLADVVWFLQRENVSPQDCVFVDDVSKYVQSAKELGIPSICFNGSAEPARKLKNVLEQIGFSL